MGAAPEPLVKDAKTIYDWFLNVYCHFDTLAGSADTTDRRKRCTEAWLRFRRATPDILQTKDKSKVTAWIPADWERVNGSAASEAALGALRAIEEEEQRARDAAEKEARRAAEDAETAQTADNEDAEEAGFSGEPKDDSGRNSGLPRVDTGASEVEQDDADVGRVAFSDKYFNAYIEDELNLDVAKWDAAAVRDFIHETARKAGVKEERMRTIATAAYTTNIDGALLLAGGADLLMERTVGHCKWERSILKNDGNKIMAALRELQLKACASYWQRNARLRVLYATSVVREALEAALMPRPREDIRYVLLCARSSAERAASITNVDEDVAQKVSDKRQQFKVVSVVTPDDTMTVLQNVVYYHEPKTHTWRVLASVDFAAHGEAPSGHWHMNRAPLGELVPHWGPSNDIFHGDPVKCPIWWILIPDGMKYHTVPARAPLYSWAAE